MELGTVVNLKNEQQYKRNHYSHLFSHSRIILSSGVNDEPVLQEDKSKESIDHSRSVFSTPTIPTGNQVTKSVNKPHYPKSFGNCRVVYKCYSVRTLTFNILFQRNDLVYLRLYSERQEKLHRIIEKLQEYRHMSLKSIADKLNALGIKTHRGKSFSSGSIHSILKRKKERDKWIEEVRNKEFPIKILNFELF